LKALDNIQVIIEAAREKKASAQRTLVDHFSDYLYAIAIRYMSDREFAKDMLQKSWLKILNNLESFDPYKGSFKSWSSKIVINTCLSEYRKNKQQILTINEEVLEINTEESSAIDKLETKEILKLVSELPEHYRQVFNLSVIDGYSHKEIGEMMDVTDLVSRTRLKRAKNIIRENYSKLINYTSWEKTI
jgi:RNA polymerase sigma-70 factor (ECF subfamily)